MINNSYNARLDSFSDRILRGRILSSDGQSLAETQTAEDGTETRVYPFGSLFAHVVGIPPRERPGWRARAIFTF